MATVLAIHLSDCKMTLLTEDDPIINVNATFNELSWRSLGDKDRKHEHFINRYLGNEQFPPNSEVECSCGITGIVWLNGKITWIGKKEDQA